MDKVMYALFVMLLFAGCKKEDISEPPTIEIFLPTDQTAGYASAKKSGLAWEAGAGFSKFNWSNDSLCQEHFALQFSTQNEFEEPRELILTIPIPLEAGTYPIHPQFDAVKACADPARLYTSYDRLTADGDASLATYRIDSTRYSFIAIEQIDTINKKIRGSFDLFFKVKYPAPTSFNLPDTLHFSNGRYECKL